jgi:tetratricopeptide (TPR) repeat protein
MESKGRKWLLLRAARQLERRAFLEKVEQALAPELLGELLQKPAKRRHQTICGTARYRLLGLSNHLAEAALDAVFADAGRALELGELAVEVASRLDSEVYGPREVAAAQVRSWAALGNAQRVQEHFVEAESSLARARSLLAASTGDPLERAEVLSLLGSLRIGQARYGEARAVLEEAASIFERHGDREGEAKVLLKLAKAADEAGDLDRAIALCSAAEARLASGWNRRLYLQALQVRATCLADAGRAREARAAFEELAPQYLKYLPGFGSRQRLAWLGARIHWAEGDLGRAEEEYLRIRAAFAEHRYDFDYALASLELARLYFERGRKVSAKRLAEEIVPIFRSHDTLRHVQTALHLLEAS